MPYKIEFVDDGIGTVHTGSGVLTGEELIEAACETHRFPERTRKLIYCFVDLSDAVDMKVSADDIRRIAEENRITAEYSSDGFVVIVATKDLMFGLSRMWQLFISDLGWKTNIARSRAEGIEWIRERVPAASIGANESFARPAT